MTLRARRAVMASGALLSTTMIAAAPSTAQTPAPSPEPAQAAGGPVATKASSSLRIRDVRRHVTKGRSTVVKGTLRPRKANRTMRLQVRVRGHGRWITVDKDRTNRRGHYRLAWRAGSTGSHLLRVHFAGSRDLTAAKRRIGRANVYRHALASWYGPGLYGGHLACGGRLGPGTLGVAHKSLPCGTKLTVRHNGRSARVRVIDRGPYVGAREFDLTAATKQRIGFSGTGSVLVTR